VNEHARRESGQMFAGHRFSRAKRCKKASGFSRWPSRKWLAARILELFELRELLFHFF
jgi:hypothetical protein